MSTTLNVAVGILLYLIIGAGIHIYTYKDGGLMSDLPHFIAFCVFWLPIEIISRFQVWRIRNNPEAVLKEMDRLRTYFKEERGINIEDELKKH